MHLVIYFCGTGNPGLEFKDHYNYVKSEQVKTLFVKGCDEPEVCNGQFFPNLKGFASRFVDTLFERLTTTPKLRTTDESILKSVGVNFDEIYIEQVNEEEIEHLRFVSTVSDKDQVEEIESITLCGYSRGAVTCFEVAKQLQKVVPQIPVDIVANQPVPGNCYQGPGTNSNSIADCSGLTNLRNVSVILGAYTGAQTEFDLHVKKKLPQGNDLKQYKKSYILIQTDEKYTLYYVDEVGKSKEINIDQQNIANALATLEINSENEKKYTLKESYLPWFIKDYDPDSVKETIPIGHRQFFSQILPKLPRTTNQEHIIIPVESHHYSRPNAPKGEAHLHMKLAKFLNKKNKHTENQISELVSDSDVQTKERKAREEYHQSADIPPAPFPPISQLQSFFGLDKHQAYRYTDKLHPTGGLRKGMTFRKDESLIQWWQRQDKKTSLFSTQLTKKLVAKLKDIDLDKADIETLKGILKQADLWLVKKENTSTSRYYQVESLRNNLYYHLIEKGVSLEDLAKLNRAVLQETNYFLKHWTKQSNDASWFKTKETHLLDKAFKDHALAEVSKENDEKLLNAIDQWLQLKQGTQSSRYDLVINIREHLQDVITNTYQLGEQYVPI